MNSLCQFDVYGALVVIGERGKPSTGNFYTNFARYYSQRSAPAFRAVVDDPMVRKALFDGDDRLLAHAISTIASYADREGFRFDGWTGLHDQTVIDFVDKHGTPPHLA